MPRRRSTSRSRSPRAIAFRLGARIPSPRGRARAAFAFICGLGLVSIFLRQGSESSFAALTSPPLIVYAFVPGIALAALEPLAAQRLLGQPRLAKRVAWAAAAVAVGAWALYAAWDYSAQTTALHHALGRRALLAVLFSGAVLAAVMAWQLGTERSPRWLASRAITYVGERSYAVYLLHVWILFEVINIVGADTDTATLVDRDDRDRAAGHDRAVGAVVALRRAAVPRAPRALGVRRAAARSRRAGGRRAGGGERRRQRARARAAARPRLAMMPA